MIIVPSPSIVTASGKVVGEVSVSEETQPSVSRCLIFIVLILAISMPKAFKLTSASSNSKLFKIM